VEWNERGFINTDDALHQLSASQGFSHRTNRKAHFFIQPSLDAFDQFICLMLMRLHLEFPPVLQTWGASFQVPGHNALRLPGSEIAS
jgi:hypothetical protein